MPAAKRESPEETSTNKSVSESPESQSHIDGDVRSCRTATGSVTPSSLMGRPTTITTTTKTSGGGGGVVVVHGRTAYERANDSLHEDDSWTKEIALGKRVGFYRVRGELGSGNFSQVKIAVHHLTKEKVAMKTLDKTKLDEKTRQMLSREIAIMERLCHPHVVQLFEVIDTLSKVHLVMEYAGGGDLCAKVTTRGKMDETKCKSVFAQLISAVDYMHSRNVIHRDIKSENVFFATSDEEVIKVGDFGFSTSVSNVEDHLRTFCGSPPYAAPELFQDESYYGTPVDIWALGVLLYFMVTGVMPFRAQTVVGLKKLILEGDYNLPGHVSIDCRQLLWGILRKNPRERYTMAQVVDSSWLWECKKLMGPLGPRRMSGQRVPSSGAYSSRFMYHPWPRVLPEIRSKLEVDTRHQMSLLGITENMINEEMSRGCHSPVMGTFRIIIHSLHARKRKDSESRSKSSRDGTDDGTNSMIERELEEDEEEDDEDGGGDTPTPSTCRRTKKTKKSKLCCIL